MEIVSPEAEARQLRFRSKQQSRTPNNFELGANEFDINHGLYGNQKNQLIMFDIQPVVKEGQVTQLEILSQRSPKTKYVGRPRMYGSKFEYKRGSRNIQYNLTEGDEDPDAKTILRRDGYGQLEEIKEPSPRYRRAMLARRMNFQLTKVHDSYQRYLVQEVTNTEGGVLASA